jgi:glycosyltransferase involved in cell wall biosynthesis
MSKNSLVSIGLPLYNEEINIDNLIPSILNQKYENFEIIIINNGSTDNTIKKLEPYIQNDSRLRLINVSKNRGSSWSFKHLVSEAKGKYFAWIAGDMQLHPDFLKRLVKELDRDKTLVTAYSYVNLIGFSIVTRSDKFSLMHESSIERIKTLYLNLGLGTLVNGLHRMEVMKELFISPPSGFIPIWSSSRQFNFGDLQLLTFLLLKGKIKQVSSPLINRDLKENLKYRSHFDVLSRNEGYFCHRHCNIGLPSYNGIHEIISRLYQSDLNVSELIELKTFIVNILKKRFSTMVNSEVVEVLNILGQRSFTKAWSDKYSVMNEREVTIQPQIIKMFLHEIYADIQLASIYSNEEEVFVAAQLCEQFLEELE